VFNLGASEIAVILVVALLFLGPKMLPEIATVLGKLVREFRKATADIRQDIELDDMIRKPLQELRDAATLPPEELKRRDEAKAARLKAEQAAKESAKQAEEAERKQREAKEKDEAAAKRQSDLEKAAVAAALPSTPAEVISPGGTMIANPPPSDDLPTLTPLPDLHSPPPIATALPHLPPPPVPRPSRPSMTTAETVSDATVIDLHAQLKASGNAPSTVVGRPAQLSPRPAQVVPAPVRPTPTDAKGKKG
jgi:Tat protein translocase TatB subunit